MIELWGRKNSYNVQKILWLLAELKLDYQHHDIGSNAGDLDSPAFRQLNPHARIPVLVDQGQSIWESNTILRYPPQALLSRVSTRQTHWHAVSWTAGWTGS